jgi:hypothetical protein
LDFIRHPGVGVALNIKRRADTNRAGVKHQAWIGGGQGRATVFGGVRQGLQFGGGALRFAGLALIGKAGRTIDRGEELFGDSLVIFAGFPLRVLNPIQIRRQVVGQRSLEGHADGQDGATRQGVSQFDLLSNHVAADRIRREQRDEETRRPDPAFDLLDPFVADEHLSVNEDVDAPTFQITFEEFGEVLIRADVSVTDKDLGHETPH